MSELDTLVRRVQSYHEAALNVDRLSEDNRDLSIRLASTVTVALPFFLILLGSIAILLPMLGEDTAFIVFAIGVLVAVFGISSVTDRIFERNREAIRQAAAEIRDDPDRGKSWARGRLAVIYGAEIAVFAVLASLVAAVL